MNTTTLKELKAQTSPVAKEQALKNTIRELHKENTKLLEELGDQERFVERIVGSVEAAEPFPPYTFSVVKKSVVEAAAVIKLSDWQIGEIIKARETEGFGKYNLKLAKSRVFSIIDDFVKWSQVQRRAYEIKECHVFCEGDFVSGDIHDELRRTNEFPLPVQTEEAGLLLGEVLLILASHFKTLHVWQVAADNHGRLTQKTRFKFRAADNMNHLVYALANAKSSRCRNIVVHRSEAIMLLADVLGNKVLTTHGNDVNCYMGTPYYGLSRGVGREATRRMNTKLGFKYLSTGHWHVPAIIEDRILVNGSLCGTSEYDHAVGRFAHPSQCAYLMSRKHGYFNWVPFRAKD